MNPGSDDPLTQGEFDSGADGVAPRTVGPYEILEELGRGCMGVVYRVRRPSDGQEFALKVVLDERPSAEALGRFAREAQVGIRLRHPGIVPVVDLGQAGGRMYLVMEYCPGPTLKDRLRAGSLTSTEAALLVAEVADAVAAAHEQGVLHRDLKPANVILDERTGAPRVTDFGLARDQRDNRSLTASGQAVGTPSHMAPEQIRGLEIDARAEVWALGVVLYECLSGRLPFPAETYTEVGRQILHEEPPSPGGDNPALAAYALAMLSKSPEHRPENPRVVAQRLRELADPAAVEPPPAGGPLSGPLALGAVAGATTLVLALLLGWLLLWEPTASAGPPPPPPVEPDSATSTPDPRGEALLEEAERLAAEREVAERVLPLLAEAEPLLQGRPELLQRLLLGRLDLLVNRGRYEEALAAAEALIAKAEPALAYPARRLKGWALFRLDQREAGMQAWRELAELDPEGVEGFAARSRVAFFSGDTAHGAEYNRKALDLEDPLQPRGFLRETAGYGALQEGDTERALEWLSEAERLVPDSPRV
ncbi:MAG: protein kinase, partial [Planctomycetes bacterium]|nr:protein kinase [Planctomycetota bacterium]